jgi:hypothetical protein
MARSKVRTVAGAGTVAAFLLVGGAAIPVVSADPGHSHDRNSSHRGGDSRDDRDSRHGDGRRGERGRDDDGGWQRDDDTIGPNRTNDASGLKPSDGASRTAQLNPDRTEVATGTGTTSRSAVVNDSSVSQSPIMVGRVDGPVTRAALVPTPPVAAAPARPVSEGGGGGGGGAVTVAAPPITPPLVTVGNGRSPGILSGRDAPAREGPVDVVVPAVTPQAVAPPLPQPYRLEVTPAQHMVASLWSAAAPGWPGGLLFGLAGLILAPIAGAWLGYRQARASRAAAQLIRH